MRTNVTVGVRYLDSWLHGVGAAAIDNLMEDAATAEISRSQLWQWVRHGHVSEQPVRDEIGSWRPATRRSSSSRRRARPISSRTS